MSNFGALLDGLATVRGISSTAMIAFAMFHLTDTTMKHFGRSQCFKIASLK